MCNKDKKIIRNCAYSERGRSRDTQVPETLSNYEGIDGYYTGTLSWEQTVFPDQILRLLVGTHWPNAVLPPHFRGLFCVHHQPPCLHLIWVLRSRLSLDARELYLLSRSATRYHSLVASATSIYFLAALQVRSPRSPCWHI